MIGASRDGVLERRGRGSAGVVALVAAVLLSSAGCQSGDRDEDGAGSRTPSAPSDVVEVQPGAPGEGGTARSPGEPVPTSAGTHADIAFTQMMVLHHRQALDMGELAETRAHDEQVRTVAARISAAQAPEILVMAGWLVAWGVEVPQPDADPASYDHSRHGHAGMVGMLSPAEMAQLAEARGAAFDRAYLTGMIRHHEGAIAMANDVLADDGDARVTELATDIVATQGAEIVRLRRLLASLNA